MSNLYDSVSIMGEALDDLGGVEEVDSLHQFTKAIIAVLERHGFLAIVDAPLGGNDGMEEER